MTRPAAARAEKRAKKAPARNPLDRSDWLDAAEAAIAEGGFSNARVLPLSDRLGVTRGSFYWHFENHPALIAQIIGRWKDRQLAELAAWRDDQADPLQALTGIVDFVAGHLWTDARRSKIEFALRDFAGGHKLAAKALAEVDLARTELFYAPLKRLTGSEDEAEANALLFYAQLVGAQQMALYAAPGSRSRIVAKLRQAILDALNRLAKARAPRARR